MDHLFEEIRDYLLQQGCKIEYPMVVNHFKSYLYNPDSQVQSQIRTQFKDHVNRLATVSVENNMKFINLRPEYRQQTPRSQNTPNIIAQKQQVRGPNLTESPQRPTIPQHMVRSHTDQTDNSPQSPRQPLQPVRDSFPIRSINQPINENYQPQRISQPAQRNQMQSDHYQRLAQVQSNLNIQANHRSYQQQPSRQETLPQTHSQISTKPIQNNDISYHRPIQYHHQSNSVPTPLVQSRTNQHDKLKQSPPELDQPSVLPLTPKHETSNQMPPPRPPPRRRQSNASLFGRPIDKSRTIESRSHNELNDLVKKSPVKVKERALRLNSYSVASHLNNMVNLVKSHSMRENRLSRESILGSTSSASQRLGYNPSMRSRSSHREDESDSSSFQPMDMLRKRWIIEACKCNYRALDSLLVEDQTLSTYKDTVGYTAIHWAAKSGNVDIINLLIGKHGVSVDIKTNSGYTPLHLAYMFKQDKAVNLLLNVYKANPSVRDYAGRRPHQLSQINKG